MKKALNLRIDKIERKINDDEKSTLELPFLLIFDHYIGPVTREITTVGPSSESPTSEEPSLNRAKRKFKLEHDAVGSDDYYYYYCVPQKSANTKIRSL